MLGWVLVSSSVQGGERPTSTISIDAHLSMEMGADVTRSTAAWWGHAESRLWRRLDGHGAFSVLARATRVAAFDLPVAWWWSVVEHEAFGHAGRARAFGAATHLRLGSPWRKRSAGCGFDSARLTTPQLIEIYAGGSESNGLAATMIERELVGGRRYTSFEMLFMAASRVTLSDYVINVTPDPSRDPQGFRREAQGGGDVANTLTLQDRLWNGGAFAAGSGDESMRQGYARMRRQAYWNAADPGLWLALYGVVRHVATGADDTAPPLPRLALRPILPILSSNWGVEGSSISLEIVVGSKHDEQAATESRPRWTAVHVRSGNGPGGRFHGVGLVRSATSRSGPLRLGGEMELWRSADRKWGGGVRVRALWARGFMANSFLDMGYKSAGQWPGHNHSSGFILRAGVALPMRP
jgi:hypothetical protein